MPDYIDLHIHTHHSDGLQSCAAVLEKVRRAKLKAFSITDHDTLEGYFEMRTLLRESDPELVPGMELSAEIEKDDLHILGYLFDPEDPKLLKILKKFREKRKLRGRKIVEKLSKLGLGIPYEAVEQNTKGDVVGRPHIAEALFKEKKTRSYQEAFDKYIGTEGPAYVPKTKMTPKEAIDLIHHAGGVAILAHPFIGDMVRYFDMLAHLNLDGIEVYHYSHRQGDTQKLIKKAKEYGFIISGGSDFHGRESRPGIIGSIKVPYSVLENLKKYQTNIRG